MNTYEILSLVLTVIIAATGILALLNHKE